jgi:hypothetical protein
MTLNDNTIDPKELTDHFGPGEFDAKDDYPDEKEPSRENMPVSVIKRYNLPTSIAHLNLLVGQYYDIQNHRIKAGNRIFALSEFNGVPIEEANKVHLRIIGGTQEGIKYAGLKDVEAVLAKEIKEIVDEHPLWTRWLKGIKGIGPILAGGWISGLATPERFPNVAKLWAYCGYHTVPADMKYAEKFKTNPRFADALAGGRIPALPDDQNLRMAAHRVRGQRANWSSSLKTLGWKTGESFVKASKGQYRPFYDEQRAHYEQSRPETSDAHRFAMAKRKTVKLFLSHMWEVWRRIEGLPVTKPYVFTHMGHRDFIAPYDWDGDTSFPD